MLLPAILTSLTILSGAIATCGEPTNRICFGPDGGTSQDVSTEDILYVATAV